VTHAADDRPVALVVGVTGDIGRAVAERLHLEGHRVVGTSRVVDSAATKRMDLLPQVTVLECDVTSDESVASLRLRLVESPGRPASVVVCAGHTDVRPLLTMSTERFEDVIDSNLTGSFRILRTFTKDMLKARYGRVVLIGSVAGHWGGRGQANYSASKAGLLGLARSTTRELAGRGITVNVVAPGPIESRMMDASIAPRAKVEDEIPAGRYGTPWEVAHVVAALCHRDAGYVSGALIPVDGGMGMGS